MENTTNQDSTTMQSQDQIDASSKQYSNVLIIYK